MAEKDQLTKPAEQADTAHGDRQASAESNGGSLKEQRQVRAQDLESKQKGAKESLAPLEITGDSVKHADEARQHRIEEASRRKEEAAQRKQECDVRRAEAELRAKEGPKTIIHDSGPVRREIIGADGARTTIHSNNTKVVEHPFGARETRLPSGTLVVESESGAKSISGGDWIIQDLPSGARSICAPDGRFRLERANGDVEGSDLSVSAAAEGRQKSTFGRKDSPPANSESRDPLSSDFQDLKGGAAEKTGTAGGERSAKTQAASERKAEGHEQSIWENVRGGREFAKFLGKSGSAVFLLTVGLELTGHDQVRAIEKPTVGAR
jgi:hypothetical protein